MPVSSNAAAKELSPENAQRQRWLSALAGASSDALSTAIARLEPLPPYQVLRAPECGMIMLRGRVGGSGRRFNLGEATVTRCSVEIEGGGIGHGFVLGRDARHAEQMALLDGLLQNPQRQAQLLKELVEPLIQARHDKRKAKGRKTAATRVDFFTMVRGED